MALVRHKAAGPKAPPPPLTPAGSYSRNGSALPPLPPGFAGATPPGSASPGVLPATPQGSSLPSWSAGGSEALSSTASSTAASKRTGSPGSEGTGQSGGAGSSDGDTPPPPDGPPGGSVQYGSLAWDSTLPSDLADLLRREAAAGGERHETCCLCAAARMYVLCCGCLAALQLELCSLCCPSLGAKPLWWQG